MKRKKVLACLGDSMTQLWGPDMPELKDALSAEYHDLEFQLHNYGVSGTRAEYGKYRITHEFPNPFGEGNKRCLSAVSPDLVIVESFAYNHRLDGRHHIPYYQDVLGQIIETIRETTPAEILFLVTIPPDKENFLDNVPTLKDVSAELRREWAGYSDEFLQAALEFAEKTQLPLANVYQRVLDEVDHGASIRWFVDQNDNIHPSRHAYAATAEEIVRAIKENQLLNKHNN